MAVTESGPQLDLDALEREVQANVLNLRAAIGRLSLDAIRGDEALREELRGCESQLDEAQAELGRIVLARAEAERRELEQQAGEERARREAACERAHELQAERTKAAKQVDRAAAKFIEAVGAYVNLAERQSAEFAQAGMTQARDAARPRGFAIEAAFACALHRSDADLRGLGLWDRLPVTSGHTKPLADADIDFSGWRLPAENES